MPGPIQLAVTTTTEGTATAYHYARGAYSYELTRCTIAPDEWIVWVTDSRRRPPHNATIQRKTPKEMRKVKHYAAFLELLNTPADQVAH